MVCLKVNAWVVLVMGVYMMSVSGAVYLFSVYSGDMKQALNLTATMIGTLCNVGTWSGVLGGIFYDRFGPMPTALVGGALVSTGYLGLHLGVAQHRHIPPPPSPSPTPTPSSNFSLSTSQLNPVTTLFLSIFPRLPTWSMGLFALLAGQGSAWTYTASLNTNAINFNGADRGKVVGSLVSFFGLCAVVFGSVAVLGSILAQKQGTKIEAHKIRFSTSTFRHQLMTIFLTSVYVLAVVVALYLAVVNGALHSVVTDLRPFAAGLLALLALLPLIIFKTPSPFAIRSCSNSEHELSINSSDIKPEEEGLTSANGNEKRDENIKPFAAVLTLDFWLLFSIFMICIGSGIITVNNLSDLVLSREDIAAVVNITNHTTPYIPRSKLPNLSTINILLVLFSASNTIGRLFISLTSDSLTYRLARPAWLILTAVLVAFTQFYLAFASIPMLYFGICVLGVGFGGTYALVPTLSSEFFGLKHFGAIFGMLGFASSAGSVLFSTLLAGRLDDHFTRQSHYCVVTPDSSCDQQCWGRQCFSYTYLVSGSASVIAIGLAVLLAWRRRHDIRSSI